MSTVRHPSTILATSLSLVALAALSACSTTAPVAAPAMQEEVKQKVATAQAAPPSIVFRAGDTQAAAFRRLGLLDGNSYIVEGEGSQAMPGNSTPIYSAADVSSYFEAHGLMLTMSPVEGSKYVRVKVAQKLATSKTKASQNCDVTLSGLLPMGAVVTDVAHKAGIEVRYVDTGAVGYSGAVYSTGYKGTCAGALEYMARKADLTASFTDSGVEYRMMDSATIDIGIPLRDRRIALDILADGQIQGAKSSGTSGSNSGSSGANNTSGGNSGGAKSMQSTYATNYLASVRSMLDSTRTGVGTWNYVAETGQVFIQDRADAVASAKANLNRLAQAFYGRFEVTLTLYRMTASKDVQVSGSLAHKLNEKLSVSFGEPLKAVAGALTGTFDNTKVGGNTKSVVQLMSQFGTVETLDTYSLTLQSGIPQTMKVAYNTEYIRNVATTSTGTAGNTTASIEQANATDGSFVTMQARQAEVGKISVDFAAFINRLDGFDTTQTQSSTVKSQRGFERTFDSMAVVDDGVPYVASILTQKLRSADTRTLPGAEGATGALGYVVPLLGGSKSDVGNDTYILVVVEARKQ